MDDCRFVHAVEFLAMDLIGVQHRRMGKRQPLAAAETVASPRRPAGEHIEHFGAPWRRGPGYADGEGIGNERLGGSASGGRDTVLGHPFDMRDDLIDDGVLHVPPLRRGPLPASGERDHPPLPGTARGEVAVRGDCSAGREPGEARCR